jgi:hypothetical protein
MQKLFQLIALAIAAIAGYRKTIKALQDQVDADSAEVKAAHEQLAQADAKANELATALNEEDAVPSVHPETFEVTSPPTASLQDLAFRENQTEGRGVAPAATVPFGAAAPAGAQAPPADQGETAEDLAANNSKEDLVALAEKEGVSSDGTKADIAAAIVAGRQSRV